jgi:hypothetical protein
MSEHLEFNELDISKQFPKRKTKVFEVRGKSDGFFLGNIAWHRTWRQYVFTPTKEEAIWSHECLADLSAFIKNLMKEREKRKKEAEKKC